MSLASKAKKGGFIRNHHFVTTSSLEDFPATTYSKKLQISSPRRKTVVVVDDCPDVHLVYELTLRSKGYHVLHAENGREGLELLKNLNRLPDLILLDVMMPVMNGLEFLEALTEIPRCKDIPVIICSASPEKFPVGVPAIEKPVRPEILFQIIESVSRVGEDQTVCDISSSHL